ncbi:MAG TPA: hypothetical protein VIE38_14240 [Gaiellaceae bacterium]
MAVVAGAFAGTSRADSNVTVRLVACAFFDGGHVTVPAGSTITLLVGEVTRTRGHDIAFLQDLALSASVDGNAIANPMSYFAAPVQIGPNGKDSAWVTWWTYPTWITLQSGDSLTSVWTGELAHPISDGLGNISSGDMLGGNDTCTITAA